MLAADTRPEHVRTPGAANERVPAAPAVTRIRVHCDVGYGNAVTIRGGAVPLSWTQGRTARNLAPGIWEFVVGQIPAERTFAFKPLVNDRLWAAGPDYVGTGGATIDVYPFFPPA
ncbi:MAG: hypothetical protein ACRDPK_16670 [Carbonactinosporaceae bacterium]